MSTIGEIHSVVEYFARDVDPFQGRSRLSSGGLGGGLGARLAVRTGATASTELRAFTHNVTWDMSTNTLHFTVGPFEPFIDISVHIQDQKWTATTTSQHELAILVVEETNALNETQQLPLLTFIISLIKVFKEESEELWPVSSDKNAWRISTSAYIARAITKDPNLFEFLILVFHAALSSYRRGSVCTPLPPSFVQQEPDWDAIVAALGKIPRLSTLDHEQGAAAISQLLQSLPDSTLELMYWLLHSARYLTPQCKPARAIAPPALPSIHKQPARVISLGHVACHTFDELAQQYGSFTAYHGSSLENFHSIFRHGLKNLSNTNYMRTGDAFGQGVYVSTDVGVAANFCGYGPVWQHARMQGQIGCVAVCKVVKHPDVLASERRDTSDSAAYFVISDDSMLRIEHVHVYHDPSTAARVTNTETDAANPPRQRRNWFFICVMLYFLLMVLIWAVRTPTYKRLSRRLGVTWPFT